MATKLILSAFVFVISVTPNACVVEQVLAAIAEMVPHGEHEHAADATHADTVAPSHSHDEEGHEEEFCCDNESYSYIVAHLSTYFSHFHHTRTGGLYFALEAQRAKADFPIASYVHRLRQPTAMRSRDRYALTSLLHAPPMG